MTKAELIKIIEKLNDKIAYYEKREEDYDERLEQLKSENERYSRRIHDSEQREKEEELFRQFPQMRPLWERKDFDF
jgi:chromosome segregation ATPase